MIARRKVFIGIFLNVDFIHFFSYDLFPNLGRCLMFFAVFIGKENLALAGDACLSMDANKTIEQTFVPLFFVTWAITRQLIQYFSDLCCAEVANVCGSIVGELLRVPSFW